MSFGILYVDGEEQSFIEEDSFHISVEFDWDGDPLCAICGELGGADHESQDEDHLFTEPGWEPNSMHIDKGMNGEVNVGISVSDPRGYFAMTIRPVDGRLIMHVPYPNMGWAHAPLKELHEGTYEIG